MVKQVSPNEFKIIKAIYDGLVTNHAMHQETDLTFKEINQLIKSMRGKRLISLSQRHFFALIDGTIYECAESKCRIEKQPKPKREAPKAQITVTKITPEEYDRMYQEAMSKHRIFTNKNNAMFLNPFYKPQGSK